MLLPHRAVLAVVCATKAFLDQVAPNVGGGTSINKEDCMLSYLPLAHIFDRHGPRPPPPPPPPPARTASTSAPYRQRC